MKNPDKNPQTKQQQKTSKTKQTNKTPQNKKKPHNLPHSHCLDTSLILLQWSPEDMNFKGVKVTAQR